MTDLKVTICKLLTLSTIRIESSLLIFCRRKSIVTKKLVEYKLEQGGTVLIEVEETEEERGRVPVARKLEMPEEATKEFEKALDEIRPVVDTIVQKLKDLSSKPDNIGVEFGIKMNTQAGAIIAATGVEANFKITLSWNKT